MNTLDWGLIRSFLAVARAGSVSAAASELGVSQPTVSRAILSLESATELNLFRRTTQGLVLTEQGQRLVDAADQMHEAADRFQRQATGLSTALEGDVRISANEIIGTYLLPPAIAAFRAEHPGVNIDIVISNRASSLSKREADIALRMFRPTQPDLVARRLPDIEVGFHAHRDYLERYGAPHDFASFLEHTIIGYDEDMDFINDAQKLGYHLARDNFRVRSDSLLMHIQLLRAGAGIAGTHVALAKRWPELRRVLEWVPVPPLEFWCVAHGDVQFNARIREFMQFLIAWFADDPYRHVLT